MLESHQLQTTLKPAFQEDFSILLIPKHLHMVLDHREVYFEASFNPHLLKIKLIALLIKEAPFFFPIMSSSSINYSSPSPPAPPLFTPFPPVDTADVTQIARRGVRGQSELGRPPTIATLISYHSHSFGGQPLNSNGAPAPCLSHDLLSRS